MKKPMITIHDISTNEVIEREMTADEFAELKTRQAEAEAKAEADATKAADKAALLAQLGITEDQAKLLLS